MNKHYLFLPVVFIIIIITTLLGFKSEAQELKNKQIQIIKVYESRTDDTLITRMNTVIVDNEQDNGLVKKIKVTENDEVSNEGVVKETFENIEDVDAMLTDSEYNFDRLLENEVMEEVLVEMHKEEGRNKQFIFIGNSGDDITIEREGEVIFINKENGIEQLNSDMHIEYTSEGKQAIVIQTMIVLDELDNSEIMEMKSQDISTTKKAPEFEYMRFYPNPTKSHINISFRLNEPANTNVKITNVLGQVKFEEKLSNFSGTYNELVDVSDFGRGTYILNIQQGKRSISKKIIVE